MQKKTHALVGVALSTVLLNPSSIKIGLITITASAIGSLLPDIDVSTSDSHKAVNTITIISLLLIIGSFILDYFFHYGLISLFLKKTDILGLILCMAIFIFLCAHGLHTPHRTFMHSFLAAGLFTFLIYLMFKPAFLPFLIGYISHIFIDLFNKKRAQLLYPLDIKLCFNLCESDGMVNKLLCIFSIIIMIILR